MTIKFAAYQGRSLLSKIIRSVTYSKYSHIALLFEDGMEVEYNGKVYVIGSGAVIEAWTPVVRLVDSMSAQHTPFTHVDVFKYKTPLTEEAEVKMARFLVSQIGKRYDKANVMRFVPITRLLWRQPPTSYHNRSRMFCSELAMEASIEAGRPLLERCPSWQVPPRDIPRSPLLMLEREYQTH